MLGRCNNYNLHSTKGNELNMNYLEYYRNSIIEQYEDNPTECGGSFGELLCWEIHSNGLTFLWLAEKWGISVSLLGELIRDHCYKLEALPLVNHNYKRT